MSTGEKTPLLIKKIRPFSPLDWEGVVSAQDPTPHKRADVFRV